MIAIPLHPLDRLFSLGFGAEKMFGLALAPNFAEEVLVSNAIEDDLACARRRGISFMRTHDQRRTLHALNGEDGRLRIADNVRTGS